MIYDQETHVENHQWSEYFKIIIINKDTSSSLIILSNAFIIDLAPFFMISNEQMSTNLAY